MNIHAKCLGSTGHTVKAVEMFIITTIFLTEFYFHNTYYSWMPSSITQKLKICFILIASKRSLALYIDEAKYSIPIKPSEGRVRNGPNAVPYMPQQVHS